jgi:hypothetical protein
VPKKRQDGGTAQIIRLLPAIGSYRISMPAKAQLDDIFVSIAVAAHSA